MDTAGPKPGGYIRPLPREPARGIRGNEVDSVALGEALAVQAIVTNNTKQQPQMRQDKDLDEILGNIRDGSNHASSSASRSPPDGDAASPHSIDKSLHEGAVSRTSKTDMSKVSHDKSSNERMGDHLRVPPGRPAEGQASSPCNKRPPDVADGARCRGQDAAGAAVVDLALIG